MSDALRANNQTFLGNPLNDAALRGDTAGVVAAVAHLVADVCGPATVAVGRVQNHRLALTVWHIDRGLPYGGEDSMLSVNSQHPAAEAVRTKASIDWSCRIDGSTWDVDVAVPIVARETAVGVVGVKPHRGQDTYRLIENLAELAARSTLAFEYSTLHRESRQRLHETVSVLAALIEGRDAYTEQHCVNLAEMSLAIGLRVGLPDDRLDLLTYGGLLHDIGKVAIPDSILHKPGPLSDPEFEQMKTHASVGENTLLRISSLADVAPIVGQHHERFDGSGYPRGLKADNILYEARVLAVVDAFDAMTTTRPYRAALSWSRAVEEISAGSKTQFDPDVTQVFLRYLEGEEAQWRTSTI
ncbi:MAG: HD-GYP domain-containing protein [Acidimicrobiia bacterium]